MFGNLFKSKRPVLTSLTPCGYNGFRTAKLLFAYMLRDAPLILKFYNLEYGEFIFSLIGEFRLGGGFRR
jgi:hypothetical protein